MPFSKMCEFQNTYNFRSCEPDRLELKTGPRPILCGCEQLGLAGSHEFRSLMQISDENLREFKVEIALGFSYALPSRQATKVLL